MQPLKSEDDLKNEENLKNEDNFIEKTEPSPSLHKLSCACFLFANEKRYALDTFCEVFFFFLNIFTLVFAGKEFRCKCNFCIVCCQTLVLSGLLFSQSEKEE